MLTRYCPVAAAAAAAAAAAVVLAVVLASAAHADGPGGGVCDTSGLVVTVCAEDSRSLVAVHSPM
ncbi:hypothetical protein ACFCZV_24590 [Streptomyces hydrogenans]|uniref:hypothetical protein n=1 Tax=Streptomyces hydrogenans TaxID=1873719 RepID=UPI0035DF9F56